MVDFDNTQPAPGGDADTLAAITAIADSVKDLATNIEELVAYLLRRTQDERKMAFHFFEKSEAYHKDSPHAIYLNAYEEHKWKAVTHFRDARHAAFVLGVDFQRMLEQTGVPEAIAWPL